MDRREFEGGSVRDVLAKELPIEVGTLQRIGEVQREVRTACGSGRAQWIRLCCLLDRLAIVRGSVTNGIDIDDSNWLCHSDARQVSDLPLTETNLLRVFDPR